MVKCEIFCESQWDWSIFISRDLPVSHFTTRGVSQPRKYSAKSTDSGRLGVRLRQAPTDVWSCRERLALASSVLRSGDQNWVSASRAVRPFGNPDRPSDWFSQINCARQYSELLEKVEAPRRKRGEREVVETPGDIIVRKLTIERIEELKKIITEEAEKYRALKKDLEMVRSGQMDGSMKELWEKLQADKAAAAQAAAKKAAEEAAAREQAKLITMKTKRPIPSTSKDIPASIVSDVEDNTQDSFPISDLFQNDDSILSEPTPGPSSSSLMPSFVTSPPTTILSDSISQSLLLQPDSNSSSQMQSFSNDPVVLEEIKQEPVGLEDDVSVPLENENIILDALVKTEELVETVEPQNVVEPLQDEPISEELKIDCEKEEVKSPAKLEISIKTSVEEELPPFCLEEEVPKNIDIKIDAEEVEVGCTESVESHPPEENEIPFTEEKDKNQTQQDVEVLAAPAEEEIVPLKSFETEEGEPAMSPASSILSTEAASAKVTQPTKRGKPLKAARRQSRTRQSEEGKESEVGSKPSEAETSDDEMARSHADDSAFLTSMKQPRLDLVESLPNSPASFSHSDTEDERAHKVWKKSIMLVWRAASNHKYANIFLHPVTEDIAPGYSNVVFRPMDLQTIRKNIDIGVIRTTAEFQRDMMLMFTNAFMYNSASHNVHIMAKAMYQDVMNIIEQFVNTQMMVQAEPKILRTLRRSDASGCEKDEDPKRRKLSEHEPITTPTTTPKKRKQP